MRLTCPGCGAVYEVAETAIPAGGRRVTCSACGTGWQAAPEGLAPGPPAVPVSNPPADEAPSEPTARRPADAVSPEGMRVLRAEAAREQALRAAAAGLRQPPGPSVPEPLAPKPTAIAGRQGEAAPKRRRSNRFRWIFATAMAVYLAGLGGYVWHERLGAWLPPLAPAFEAYAGLVDGLRSGF